MGMRFADLSYLLSADIGQNEVKIQIPLGENSVLVSLGCHNQKTAVWGLNQQTLISHHSGDQWIWFLLVRAVFLVCR